MGKMLRKAGLLFFSCIISFSAFAMRDVSSKLPSQADDETQELAQTYENTTKISIDLLKKEKYKTTVLFEILSQYGFNFSTLNEANHKNKKLR